VTKFLASAGAGLLLAVVGWASPLTVWAIAAGVALCVMAGRDLPLDERRALTALLAAALAARAAIVAAMLLQGLPHLNDLSVGALAGDEAYYLARAIRIRDILAGFADSKFDYFVVTDEYGRTSYLTLLAAMQILFGPTPYSMRLVNAVLFAAGAVLLFRVARRAYGPLPAFLGLALLLFLPSLFAASVSLLKESLYFFATAVFFVCVGRTLEAPQRLQVPQVPQVSRGLQAPQVLRGLAMLIVAAGSLWLVADLRRGAGILIPAGVATALVIRALGSHGRRWAAAGTATVALAVGLLSAPTVRARAVDAVEEAAKLHAGHVFTVGHAYKLMDESFYMYPEAPNAWDLRLTETQAARFLVRAAVSFLFWPVPWHIASRSELAFLPEHLLWYVVLALLPLGIAAGWRRHPLATCLFVGFVVPTAAALAVTNGNIGTLLRLRGLVTPYLIWVAALGACAAAEGLLAGRTLGRVADTAERGLAS
jgi:hypothetical protein